MGLKRMRKVFILISAICLSGCSKTPPERIAVGEGDPRDRKIDVMLVLDSSGSMKRNDPSNLRIEAAKLFVSLLPYGCRVGVIDFSDQARVIHAPGEIFNEQDRIALLSSIDTLGSEGQNTDILAGLKLARAQQAQASSANRRAVIILVTDGRHQPDLSGQRYQNLMLPDRPDVSIAQHYKLLLQEAGDDPQLAGEITRELTDLVHETFDRPELLELSSRMNDDESNLFCVSLSRDSDRQLLDELVRRAAPDEAKPFAFHAADASDLCARFVEIIETIMWIDDGPHHWDHRLESGDQFRQAVPIDPFVDQAFIVVAADEGGLESELNLRLFSSGKSSEQVSASHRSRAFAVYTMRSPQSGQWRIEAETIGGSPAQMRIFYLGFSNLAIEASAAGRLKQSFVNHPVQFRAAFRYSDRFALTAQREGNQRGITERIKDLSTQSFSVALESLDDDPHDPIQVELMPTRAEFTGSYTPKNPGRYRATFTGHITEGGGPVVRKAELYFTVRSELFWHAEDGGEVDLGDIYIGWLGHARSQPAQLTSYSSFPDPVRLELQAGQWSALPEDVQVLPSLIPKYIDIPANSSAEVGLVVAFENTDRAKLRKGKYQVELLAVPTAGAGSSAPRLEPITVQFRVIGLWGLIRPYVLVLIGSAWIYGAAFLGGWIAFWLWLPWPSGTISIDGGPARAINHVAKKNLWQMSSLNRKNRVFIGSGGNCELQVPDLALQAAVLRFGGRRGNRRVSMRVFDSSIRSERFREVGKRDNTCELNSEDGKRKIKIQYWF